MHICTLLLYLSIVHILKCLYEYVLFKKPLRFLKNPAMLQYCFLVDYIHSAQNHGLIFFRSLQFPENVTVIFLQTLHILAKFKFHQSTYYGIIYLLTLLFYPSYGSMFGRVTNYTKVMPLV